MISYCAAKIEESSIKKTRGASAFADAPLLRSIMLII